MSRQAVQTTLDRLPPHSTEAEQGVLGCCLLDPNTCLLECQQKLVLKGKEFYDLRHQTIYEVLADMWEDRQPIDLISVQQTLKDKGFLQQIGGITYLSQLQDAVPSAANLAYYLDIVTEKSVQRELIQTASGLVGKAFEHTGEIDLLVNEAEREILAIRQKRETGRGETDINGIIISMADNFERAAAGEKPEGLATGFRDLDRILGTIKRQEMIVIAGTPSAGKAQPLSAKVLTPSGFVNMGDILVGDYVVGSNGKPCQVLGVYPQGIKEVFEVEFSDGSKTRCCKEHLWTVSDKEQRRFNRPMKTLPLEKIMQKLKRSDSDAPNYCVPQYKPVEWHVFEPECLPIDAWLLGALIGDGKLGDTSICFYKPEADVQQKFVSLLPEQDMAVLVSDSEKNAREGGLRIKRKDRSILPSATAQIIRQLGLNVSSYEKFIPKKYLFSSVESRLRLLQGLLDTDGSVFSSGIEYSTSSERLAKDFVFLCRSLAIPCVVSNRIPKYTYKGEKLDGARSWRVYLHHPEGNNKIVTSQKHLSRIKPATRRFHRSIVSVKLVGFEDCQCIKVDAPDSLYLTDDFIPTHNTTLLYNIFWRLARQKIMTGLINLDTSAYSAVYRYSCLAGQVDGWRCERGIADETDRNKMATGAGLVSQYKKFLKIRDDVNNESRLIAACRRMKQQGCQIIGIDFMQQLSCDGKSKYEKISRAAEVVKGMAKELDLPVIAISSLNRENAKEQKKPTMQDLNGSGDIEYHSNKILLLHCENREDAIREVEINCAKNKDGMTGRLALTMFAPQFRFEDCEK